MKTMREIMRSYAVLNADGVHVNGSDKESNHHFGDAYESLFVDRPSSVPFMREKFGREDVKLMMEIGVSDGSSLCAWRDIFPNALCIGVDTQQSVRSHGERLEFHQCDATDYNNCMEIVANRQFDLIVDDASHLTASVLVTLFWLWPFVQPGGLYVIEDFVNHLPKHVTELFPYAELVPTTGPTGGYEPLVVLRKPL